MNNMHIDKTIQIKIVFIAFIKIKFRKCLRFNNARIKKKQ